MKRFAALVLILLLSLTALTGAPALGEDMADSKTYTCGNYQYVILDDGTAEIVRYQSEDHDDRFGQVTLTIPPELDGLPVSAIGNRCFQSYYGIVSIVIPEGVRRIGNQAFLDLWELKSVTIPDSVIEVGANPFVECGALTEIIISPDHPVLEVRDHLLYSRHDQRLICCLLGYHDEQIDIPEGTRIIDSYAFYFNEHLTSVSIPGSVVSIGHAAFMAAGLSSVTFSEGVESIGSSAFYGCSLRYVTLPDSLKTLGENAFGGNYGLQSISVSPDHPVFTTYEKALIERPGNRLILYPATKMATHFDIPQGIEHIEPNAFEHAIHLAELTIPDSVTSIGDNAFFGCKYLRSLTIPQNVTELGSGLFQYCENLTDVVLPDSVTSIGAGWFFFCKAMTSFTVPDGVTRIENGAFYSCDNLVSITIPASVTFIADNAFAISEIIDFETNESWFITNPDLTLTVVPGSYAEQYAIDHGIKYVYTE